MEWLDDFLHKRLQVDLENKLLNRDKLRQKKEGFESLEQNVALLQKSNQSKLVTRVDMGGGVSMQAEVENLSRIFVDVGLGFHVECDLDEARTVAQRREQFYQGLLDACEREIGNIRAHIQLVIHALSVTQQNLKKGD